MSIIYRVNVINTESNYYPRLDRIIEEDDFSFDYFIGSSFFDYETVYETEDKERAIEIANEQPVYCCEQGEHKVNYMAVFVDQVEIDDDEEGYIYETYVNTIYKRFPSYVPPVMPETSIQMTFSSEEILALAAYFGTEITTKEKLYQVIMNHLTDLMNL